MIKMKSKIILALALLASINGISQFTFSVSPGLSMNRASFGFKMNRIVPFAGLQYMNTSADYKLDHKVFDYTFNTIVEHNHHDEYKLNLIMPNIGIKYFIKEVGDLKAHLTLNVMKPIVTGKVINDGDVDEDYSDYVKAISLWGGEFSFGAEYFFDEHFSIGGEFGLRYMRARFKQEEDVDIFNPITGLTESSTQTYDMKLNMSPTFSKISLNFYF